MLTARVQPAGLDRRAPPPAEAAGRQQVHRRRRFHRDDRRRPEPAHRLPLGRRPGILLPARRRDGAEDPGGRRGARHPDQGRRDVLPAGPGAALAAAQAELGRPGDRTQAAGARKGRPAVVLRALQPQAVRGIFPPGGHRERFPGGLRAFLPIDRAAHLRRPAAMSIRARPASRRQSNATPPEPRRLRAAIEIDGDDACGCACGWRRYLGHRRRIPPASQLPRQILPDPRSA